MAGQGVGGTSRNSRHSNAGLSHSCIIGTAPMKYKARLVTILNTPGDRLDLEGNCNNVPEEGRVWFFYSNNRPTIVYRPDVVTYTGDGCFTFTQSGAVYEVWLMATKTR